jgi:hypothetical protein
MKILKSFACAFIGCLMVTSNLAFSAAALFETGPFQDSEITKSNLVFSNAFLTRELGIGRNRIMVATEASSYELEDFFYELEDFGGESDEIVLIYFSNIDFDVNGQSIVRFSDAAVELSKIYSSFRAVSSRDFLIISSVNSSARLDALSRLKRPDNLATLFYLSSAAPIYINNQYGSVDEIFANLYRTLYSENSPYLYQSVDETLSSLKTLMPSITIAFPSKPFSRLPSFKQINVVTAANLLTEDPVILDEDSPSIIVQDPQSRTKVTERSVQIERDNKKRESEEKRALEQKRLADEKRQSEEQRLALEKEQLEKQRVAERKQESRDKELKEKQRLKNISLAKERNRVEQEALALAKTRAELERVRVRLVAEAEALRKEKEKEKKKKVTTAFGF